MRKMQNETPMLPLLVDCFWLEIICPECGGYKARIEEEYLVMCPLCLTNVIEIRHRAHGKTSRPLPEYMPFQAWQFTQPNTRRKNA